MEDTSSTEGRRNGEPSTPRSSPTPDQSRRHEAEDTDGSRADWRTARPPRLGIWETRAHLAATVESSENAHRFLGGVTVALSESLDYAETLDQVARLAVPALADICIVDMIEDGSMRQRAVNQAADGYEARLEIIQSCYSLDPEAPHPVWDALRTAEPQIVAPVSADPDASDQTRRSLETALAAAGVNALLVIPLVIRGRPAGALSLISTDPGRGFGPEETALAREFAARASTAIDNARLYWKAQEAIRARDRFLSIAAHELKTPMTSLRGFVQLAMRQLERDGCLDPAQARQALRVIDQQSRKLAGLISQLLDVTRLEAGRLSLERRVVNIGELVKGVVAAASDGEHQIELRTPPTALALVDSLRIEQVAASLIDNAIRFSPCGSQIDVEVCQPSRNSVQLRIRDHGPGVPLEQRSGMFTRFYHGLATEQAAGMGLGLYLAREIAALHGGSIEAEFPDDGGSRFVLTLPTGLGDCGGFTDSGIAPTA